MAQLKFGKQRELWQPFTVVVPAHNEENYLPATLSKLKESFEELGAEGRIIVVNDDSTDGTRDVAIQFGAEIVDVKLRNIGAVRNAGAKACQTGWLFFLDADTLLPAKTLALALDRLALGDAGGGALVSVPADTKINFVKWMMFLSLIHI